MKQLLFALKHAWGLALLLCGLLSCLAGVGYSAEDSIEKATPRHLVAVIPADLPPTYFLDKSGKAAGFSIDVMDQLAA